MHSTENIITQELQPHCWYLPCNSDADRTTICNKIDKILTHYSFYHERDWANFNCLPLEGHEPYGAWRDNTGTNFIFLLDNPKFDRGKKSLLLHVTGQEGEIKALDSKIRSLKLDALSEVEKDRVSERSIQRFDTAVKSKYFVLLTSIITVLTAVFNLFSWYLRKIPSPKFEDQHLTKIYNIGVAIIHFIALFEMIIFTLILFIILLKYSRIFIRKM